MTSADFSVTAVASPGDYLASFSAAERVPTHAIPMERRVSPVRDLIAIGRLVRLLRRLRPDIVHSHTPKAGLLGMLAASILGVPVRIYHMRGLPVLSVTGVKRLLLTWSEVVACRLAHRVICVSPSVRAVAIEQGLVPATRIIVLAHGSGNGVDASRQFNPATLPPSTREQVRTNLAIRKDDIVIGFVGRLVREKGIVELVEAWKIAVATNPHLRLLLVGPFEPQNPVPHKIRAIMESDNRIHLTGLEWNTPPYYAAMDMFVLPTYREGFPNGVLEASAMRLPVIATRVPGCVDAVVDGETGTLVPPGDSFALARTILDYGQDRERRAREGEAGRQRVAALFKPESIWVALKDQYLQLLHERGRQSARR